MSFTLTEDQLRNLFESANFPIFNDEMVFFGLRGCTPVDEGGTPFAGVVALHSVARAPWAAGHRGAARSRLWVSTRHSP